MKKLAIVIVLIILVVLFFITRDNSPTDMAQTSDTESVGAFRPDPSSATFILDNEEITLSEGKSTRTVAPGSALTEEITLMDKFTYGDINGDGKEDTVLLLARYGGGSGVFVYLATFISGPVTYKGSRAMFIGDRIAPQSLSINEGIVTVRYLDRKDGEAFAAEPTTLVSKQFIFRNEKFQEQ